MKHTYKNNIQEGLSRGEYYIWKIDFQDGTSTSVKIKWDETSQESLESHFGKPIATIDRDLSIHSNDSYDPRAAKEYHDQQDRLERSIAKQPGHTVPKFNENRTNRPATMKDSDYKKMLDEILKQDSNKQLNELSPDTERNYVKKANQYRSDATDKHMSGKTLPPKELDKIDRRAERTMKVINKQPVEIDELSNSKMDAYVKSANAPSAISRPLRKIAHTVDGVHRAQNKIKQKTDNTVLHHSKTYEDVLSAKLEALLLEALSDDFADILNKQHTATAAAKKPRKTTDIPYYNWTIRYRPNGGSSHEIVPWQIMNKKGEIVHTSKSSTDKDAIQDAEEWINAGGGTKTEANKNVTIDFNVDFAKEFAPDGAKFYATIESDKNQPMLVFSTVPQKGLKGSHIRTQKSKMTSGTTQLPMISMTPAESNAAGLQPFGRYVLGDKDKIDNDSAIFPLIYHGTVQGPGDMMKLGKPALTVAHPRNLP